MDLVGPFEQLDNERVCLDCEQAFGGLLLVIANQYVAIGRYMLQFTDAARRLLAILAWLTVLPYFMV